MQLGEETFASYVVYILYTKIADAHQNPTIYTKNVQNV